MMDRTKHDRLDSIKLVPVVQKAASAKPVEQSRRMADSDVLQPASSRLSEEAQDLICLFIEESANGVSGAVATATFRSLCLVSKAWLSPARRRLYRGPFFWRSSLTWRTALSLLSTLQDSPSTAHHVRNLAKLSSWSVSLSRQVLPSVEDTAHFARRRQTISWSFQLAILDACPLVTSVSASVQTPAELNSLAKTVKGLKKTLRSLSLSSLIEPSREPTVAALKSWFARADVEELEELVITGLGRESSKDLADLPTEPTFGVRLDKLQLVDVSISFPGLYAFIPTQTSYLTSLHVTFSVRYAPSAADMTSLVNIISPTITTLALVSQNSSFGPSGVYPIPNSQSQDWRPQLPLAMFSHLSEIKNLTLQGFQNFSHSRLEGLQKHSPKLERLDLKHTVWDSDNPHSPSESPFSESTAIATLDAMPNLLKAHLGWLPLRYPKVYASLHEAMLSKAVMIDYQTSLRRCAACGEYH
ncbi:hypothetical protein MNV49_005528 [Pseudohyphozyma bogoriensis]|nr:hypothetical protein MNV49_005528 [Pseudohyphozyma bogoriensis]